MMMPRQATIRPLARKVRSFIRDESGVMAVQILFFFFMMLLVGGVAVDLMRFEARRVAVQQTMDRATLAAASLENELDPEQVVTSYFEAAGLDEDLDQIVVTETANSRNVRAKATVRSDNYFMSMLDVPYLEAANRSEAEQSVTDVEIVMVLDVSGSMYNTPTRISGLKGAAKEFIDLVLDQDTENRISIAIVPYNGQVSLGPQLFSKFTVSDVSGVANSYCLELPTSTYSSTALSRSTPLRQVPFGDSWSGTSTNNSYTAIQGPSYDSTRGLYSNTWCQPVPGNYIRMHNNNRSQLKAQIDGLVAVGATSIDLGMKWGSFLLDPSSQSISSEMATAGQIPSYFGNRPSAFTKKDTQKVIVLMTDGENFTQERWGNYRTGLSPIYRSNGDGMLSIRHTTGRPTCAGTKEYWVPHRWSTSGTQPCSTNGWQSTPWNSGSGVTQLTWQQVWQLARTDWVAWQMYARALTLTGTSARTTMYNTWNDAFVTYVDTTTMNTRLDEICEKAKAQGVEVYGIAFEAPAGGQAAIQDCASSASGNTYYFAAWGPQIYDAFRLIASNISKLRLTQ